MAITLAHQKRHQMRDVTVMTCTPFSGGTAGTPVAFLGLAETFDFDLERMYGDATSSADTVISSRPLRWGTGSVKLTGFFDYDANAFAALFATGAYVTIQITESATGAAWQLLCRLDKLSESLGKEQSKATISLTQEGAPWFMATSGGTLAALPLD